MAWTVTVAKLEHGVADARDAVEEHRSFSTLAELARGLRWVDELAESRAVFRAAAVDLAERIEQRGTRGGPDAAEAAGYFALAGEPAAARAWADRAVAGLCEPLDASGAPVPEETIRRNRATAVATLYLIASAVKRILAERVAPSESSGQVPFDDWDWLELGFAVRARIAGETVPDHRRMLERAGLLGAGRDRRRVVRLARGVVARFSVTAADGTLIEARVDHEDPRWIAIVLDPRDEHYLSLDLSWGDGIGYQMSVAIDSESSPQQRLPYEGTDFREAIAAAADWFNADDDVFGRDGPWAARTLLEITRDVPVFAG
jgi:hypothetical protein